MDRKTFLALTIAGISGCASNPYAKFYQPASAQILSTVAQRRVQPPPATPELLRGTAPKDDLDSLYGEGYVLIGQSSFNGPKLDPDDAIEQGEKVGADRVVIYGTLASTEHTVMPLVLPTTQTSVTNGTASAFGSGGSATAFGSSTTTTYGTQTTYIPITVRRYDGLALYLVKEKYAFGARFRNLNTTESQATGSVNGVTLVVVVRGSPAAAAGLLPGDIVTQINGVVVTDEKQLNDYLVLQQGQSVRLAVLHQGTKKEISVALNSY